MENNTESVEVENKDDNTTTYQLLPLLPVPRISNQREPSISSEDSSYFVDVFGRLLSLTQQHQKSDQFCPQCLPDDEDPFVGILQNGVVKPSCCHMRAYFELLPTLDSVKSALTPFGRQLLSVCQLYDVDLRSRLSEHWRRNWITLGNDGLYRYLRRFISHIDDDGVQWCFGECQVCFSPCRYIRKPSCCSTAICQLCWTNHVKQTAENSCVSTQITGLYTLHCYSCSKFVPYSETLAATENEDLDKIRPPGSVMASARCPVCLKDSGLIISDKKTDTSKMNSFTAVRKLRSKKGGSPIDCERCGTSFCAICGILNHPKISCEQLLTSDSVFRRWTKQKSQVKPQYPNGRFCPKCGIPVTHSGGCPHMVCPCGVNFCYSCGQRHIDRPYLRFLPGHTGSKLIPLITCPKLWKSQAKRIVVHSMVSFGLIFGVAPLAIATAPVAFPVICAIVLAKRLKRKIRNSKNERSIVLRRHQLDNGHNLVARHDDNQWIITDDGVYVFS